MWQCNGYILHKPISTWSKQLHVIYGSKTTLTLKTTLIPLRLAKPDATMTILFWILDPSLPDPPGWRDRWGSLKPGARRVARCGLMSIPADIFNFIFAQFCVFLDSEILNFRSRPQEAFKFQFLHVMWLVHCRWNVHIYFKPRWVKVDTNGGIWENTKWERWMYVCIYLNLYIWFEAGAGRQ